MRARRAQAVDDLLIRQFCGGLVFNVARGTPSSLALELSANDREPPVLAKHPV